MEDLITFKSQKNIINFGYTKKSCISQIEKLDTKIIILLTTNDLIIYDPGSPENTKNRHFIQEIQLIKVFQEKLFILQDKILTQLDINNLDELQKYEFKEKPYIINLKETKKFFICFYANEIHEIIYMHSYFVTELRRIYKEGDRIINIIYHKPILLWTTKSALKAFNLLTKDMILKKDFTKYIIDNNQEKVNIEVSLFAHLSNNLLAAIYERKYIFLFYYLNSDKEQKSKNKSIEIFNDAISPLNNNEYFIGMWINSNMTKLCIIKLKNDLICLSISDLDLNKINNYFFFSSKVTNFYFNKEYKYMYNPEHNIKFIIGRSNMLLHDNHEIFLISPLDKEDHFLKGFINDKEIDFNFIKDNYKIMNINRKYFLLIKIIEKDSKNNFSLFLNDNMFLEQYKYLYEELFNLKITENIKNIDKIMILYCNYILYLLKTSINIFNKLYLLLKNNFDKLLNDKANEKIIKVLLQKHQFNILKKFIIQDNNNILYSPSLEKFIQKYKSINDDNNEIKEQIINIEALLNQKVFIYKKAIKLFIDINKSDEIYYILLNKNQNNLIFDYDILFGMFDESQLANILGALYSPLNLDICIKFYDKLFYLCNEEKITKFAYYIILYEKYRLLINKEIIQKLFNISIKNNNKMIFKSIYEKYRFKSDNKMFLTKFIRDAFNMFNIDNKKIIDENINELMKKQNIDIYILLLTNIENYKKIIDIYIDHLEQPEQCIKYIENSNLNQNIKQDIYNYLGNKINNNKSLSDAKKFYYITQFQDDITIKKPDILKLFDNINYDQKSDDFDYILLILKELRLKLYTLKVSKEMCDKSSKKIFNELKNNLKKGKIVQMKVEDIKGKKENMIIKNVNVQKNKNKMKCDFDECDKEVFEYDDKLVIFKECNHCFHKECFQNIKELFNNENTKYYIENNFCPICFDII